MPKIQIGPRTCAFRIEDIVRNHGHRINSDEIWEDVSNDIIPQEVLDNAPNTDFGFLLEIIEIISKVEGLSNIKAQYGWKKNVAPSYFGNYRPFCRPTFYTRVYITGDYRCPPELSRWDIHNYINIETKHKLSIDVVGNYFREEGNDLYRVLTLLYFRCHFGENNHYLGARCERMALELKVLSLGKKIGER